MSLPRAGSTDLSRAVGETARTTGWVSVQRQWSGQNYGCEPVLRGGGKRRERALRGPSFCMPGSEQTHSHSATSFYLLGKRSPVRFTFCRSTHVPVSHQPVSGLPRASVGGATEALTGVALASLRSPPSRSRRIGPQAFRLFPRPAVPCPIAGASRLPCLRPRLSSSCSVPSLFSCLSRMPLSPEASTSISRPASSHIRLRVPI